MEWTTIDAVFMTRKALQAALLDSFPEGGLFVEGGIDVTVGTAVLIRVTAEDLGVGTFLEGVVQWRRIERRAVAAANAAPGVGVRLLPTERGKYDFLERWGGGSVEASGRAEWRYPAEIAVQVQAVGPSRSTARIMHSTIRDISAHGALVFTPMTLSTAEIVSLSLTDDSRPQSVEARVAWSVTGKAGLRLLLERKEERLVWSKTVEAARNAVTDGITQPRRSIPPQSSDGR